MPINNILLYLRTYVRITVYIRNYVHTYVCDDEGSPLRSLARVCILVDAGEKSRRANTIKGGTGN